MSAVNGRGGIAGRPPVDDAVLWRPSDLAGVEALTARYTRQEFLPHRHDAFLIGIIEQGGHAVWCRGARTTAGPHFVATMDPGEVHYGGAADAAGWRQRMLYVAEGTVANVLEDLLDRAPPTGSFHFRDCFRKDSRVAGALRHLHHVLERDRDDVLERQTSFEMVIAMVFRRFASLSSGPPRPGAAPLALERVRAYLNAHFREPCPLGELARVAGLRRRQFVEAFQRRFGLPPHRYLTQIRIDAARVLLAQRVPACDVATAVGFADQSHFVRRFKAVVGVTPGRYRASV